VIAHGAAVKALAGLALEADGWDRAQ
jgi:hypothetical protein